MARSRLAISAGAAVSRAIAARAEVAAFSAQGTAAPGVFTDLTFTLDGQLHGMTTTAIYEIDKATAVYNPAMFPIVDSGSTPVTLPVGTATFRSGIRERCDHGLPACTVQPGSADTA